MFTRNIRIFRGIVPIIILVFSCSVAMAQKPGGLSDSERLGMLTPPSGKVDVVLDTDTYNEIDDQFALVYALLSTERLNVKAVYAAPFHNSRSDGAGDGMQKSYEEILRVLETLKIPSEGLVFKGSDRFLDDEKTPVPSDAVDNLVSLSKNYSADNPLYVMAVGAITNVASAIIADPEICQRIVVVWLGGNGHNWPNPREFNYKQDLMASRIVFHSGVPLVQIPCIPITTHLTTTDAEMEYYLAGQGETAEYLLKIFKEYNPKRHKAGYSKVLWDLTAVAWVVNPVWIPTDIVHSPIITDNYFYSFNESRHLIRCANFVNRNSIFGDFFTKLQNKDR